MYSTIKINDQNYKFKTGTIETEINELNKINIFVGQNNSGKSRFMRSIFSTGKIEFKVEDYSNDIKKGFDRFKKIFENLDVGIAQSNPFNIKELNPYGIEYLSDDNIVYKNFKELEELPKKLKDPTISIGGVSQDTSFGIGNELFRLITDLYKKFTIHTIQARRNVNSKASGRGNVEEVVVVVNY